MTRRNPVLLVLCILALAAAGAVPAFGAAPPAQRTYCYLARMTQGYSESVAIQGLTRAGAEVVSVGGGWIVFATNATTRLTPFMKNPPFARNVIADPATVLADPNLKDSPAGRDFLGATAKKARQALKPLSSTASGALVPTIGADAVTPAMRAIDSSLRARTGTGPRARVMAPPPADDIYEPNDTFDAAYALPGPGTFSCVGLDYDYYKFTVAAGNDIKVRIEFANSEGDLQIALYDPLRNLLDWSEDHNDDFDEVFASNVAAGTYYVFIWPAAAGNSYTLKLDLGNLLGSIQGRVTRESTASSLPGVEVEAYNTDHDLITKTTTVAMGNYILPVPAGDYLIRFNGRTAGNYVPECYNDVAMLDDAMAVTVGGVLDTTGIDAALADGLQVEGRMYEQQTGTGLGYRRVIFHSPGLTIVDSAETDATGNYKMKGLPPGSYKVLGRPQGYSVLEWYNDKPTGELADVISGTAGQVIPDIDFGVVEGGIITGTVTDVGGNPLSGVRITVLNADGSEAGMVFTNAGGVYTAVAVPARPVRVLFNGLSGYVPEYYNDAPSFEEAAPLTVASGQTLSGIDAVLARTGWITGTLTCNSGPAIGVHVQVYDVFGHAVGTATSNGSGAYGVYELPPGPVRIRFDGHDDYAAEWYSGRDNFADADIVSVPANGSVVVNADLKTPGFMWVYVRTSRGANAAGVLGTLYNPAGLPLARVESNTAGAIDFGGLKAGSYKLHLDPGVTVTGDRPQYYNKKDTFAAANSIVIVKGLETSIVATLVSRASIVVTSPAGGPTWYTGTAHDISWVKTGTQSATVKIQLYRGTSLAKTFVSSTQNDGRFAVTLPTTLTASTDYRVKVVTSDGRVSGMSSKFAIAKPSIAITAPTAGTSWTRGTPQTIAWTVNGPMAVTVKIQLFRGTTLVTTLIGSTDNLGTYGWTIGPALPAGTNYKVKIQTTDGKVKATSAAFTLN